MNTYQIFLHTHSGLRWIVLLLALIVIVKSFIGLFGKSEYAKADNILAASYVGTLHLQFLIGLILYVFLSPMTAIAFEDFGAAMKNSNLRFWAVEHIVLMVGAAALAQVGRSMSKKKSEDKPKFRFQAIFFTISLILILFGIPWERLG